MESITVPLIETKKSQTKDTGIAMALICLMVAHLEAELCSFDRTMPEEINLNLIDAVSDILWTPSPDADQYFRRERTNGKDYRRV